MTRHDPVAGAADRLSRLTRPDAPGPLRACALLSGLALVGSFLSVFYRVVDATGDVTQLVAVVAVAFVLGTACARLLAVRTALWLGGGLFAAGLGLYLLLVPAPLGRILAIVFTVEFLRGLAAYPAGLSVLEFARVDAWAVGVAPGPVFLTWYLLARRRYDSGALVGASTLGFFVLTGDAGSTTTLVGAVGALGVLGFGALERAEGAWREQGERVGIVLVVAVFLTQLLRGVDWRGVASADPVAGPRPGPGSSDRPPTIEGSLVETDGRVRIHGEIRLSPLVRFAVTADEAVAWRVGSYDRYTGEEWVRSGQPTDYAGPLDPPPGDATAVTQRVRAETSVQALPAAWKPHRISGEVADSVRVTPAGGLVPTRALEADEEYTVVSHVPRARPADLRTAGTAYPAAIRERYLQLPESTPARVRRKARDTAAGAPTPYDAARTIEQWLEANRGYSLTVDRPDGDVADAFVFEMDRGYCVYYATAMTVLLRALDIPARFVHGYAPGVRVGDDRWVVRGLDAHAWTEAYFPGVGWMPFDPTPADPRRAAEQRRLDRARADGVEGVDTNGTLATGDAEPRRVGPVDARDLSRLDADGAPPPSTPREGAIDLTPSPDGTGGAGTADESLATALSRVDRLTLAAGVAGLALGASRLRLLGRGYRALRLRWQPATDSPAADVERAFERLEYLLARRHRPRETGETPRQYLDALDAPVDRRARRVVRIYERASYAGTVSRAEADEAIRLVDELVAEGA